MLALMHLLGLAKDPPNCSGLIIFPIQSSWSKYCTQESQETDMATESGDLSKRAKLDECLAKHAKHLEQVH